TISRADNVLHNVGDCLKKRTFQANTYQYGAIRGFFPEVYSTEMIAVRTNKRWGLDSFRYNDPSLYYASKSNDGSTSSSSKFPSFTVKNFVKNSIYTNPMLIQIIPPIKASVCKRYHKIPLLKAPKEGIMRYL